MPIFTSGGHYLTDATGKRLTVTSAGLAPPLTVSSDGAWTWFSDPRALFYNGKTYIGSITKTGDTRAQSYSDAGSASTPFTLHAALQVDEHDAPSLLRRLSDNRFLAFYSRHDGSTIDQRTSTNAEDVTAWGSETTISPLASGTFTYSQPVQLSGETGQSLRLFYRRHSGSSIEWDYNESTDGGATWNNGTSPISMASVTYIKIAQTSTQIHFACSNHPGDGPTNIWHYYLDTAVPKWAKSDGTDITAGPFPLSTSLMTTVYDETVSGVNSWIWDCAVDGTGHPVIVFATFPTTTDHRYNYAKWTGSAWSVHEICTAGSYIAADLSDDANQVYYSGGVVLDHTDPTIVYCSRQVSGQWEIFKYQTSDGGTTWTNQALTSGSAAKNIRPVVVRDHGSVLKVVWLYGTYNDYLDYNMSVLGSAT